MNKKKKTIAGKTTVSDSLDCDLQKGELRSNTEEFGIETTGRMIALFMDDGKRSLKASIAALKNAGGAHNVCHMADFDVESFDTAQAEDSDLIVYDELGIAVFNGDPDQQMAVMSVNNSENMMLEPEYMNYALEGLDEDINLSDIPVEEESQEPRSTKSAYLKGYQEGVANLAAALSKQSIQPVDMADPLETAARFHCDTGGSTWGLKATRVLRSQRSGRNVRVAVLDTGMDLRHPDFAGRNITSQSFINGQHVQDGNGHGTHCIGTACGPVSPTLGPRYGVAHEAHIFAGKVLSNQGSGADGGILAGINWALRNRCPIISMSLGSRVRPGEAPLQKYELVGRRALRAGTLIIAAAGNDSHRRFGYRAPVGSPANARSIAAVAALDSRLNVADFSNAGINPNGGEINLSAPGVDIYSSWPMPLRYRSISGTSMATPHVAGIAALIAEEMPNERGIALYRQLRRLARRLPLNTSDIGNGLAEAIR